MMRHFPQKYDILSIVRAEIESGETCQLYGYRRVLADKPVIKQSLITADDETELPDGLHYWAGASKVHIMATCCVCYEAYPLLCDLDEFDQNFSYCYGSPRCCP
jgi:hypothetical protein